MNNEQFRRLVQQTSASSGDSSTPRQDAATPSTLGSRMRSSIPMTPRSVVGSSGVDFARQLREANAPPQKKFKSTAAPKGTKLAAGYVDRAQLRESEGEDDKATRIKALEEMVKLGQMDQTSFETVRDEIIGGDVRNVHLVKGLDRKLLERARRGEDVFKEPAKVETEQKEVSPEEQVEDIDAALDEMESREVVPREREARPKDEPSGAIAGRKRTRDDILRELKASRQKAAEAAPAQPALSSKFRKLGEQMQPGTSRIEIDEKGRQVLVIMDEDGNVKRKVKKAKLASTTLANGESKNGLLMPDKNAIPLGADAPVIPQRPSAVVEPEEDDVFDGAGADYDPLGDIDDDSESDSGTESGEDRDKSSKPERKSDRPPPEARTDMPPPPKPSGPRNYFNDKPTANSENEAPSNPLKDANFIAAMRKVANFSAAPDSADSEGSEEAARKLARRKEMLSAQDRDAEDIDLGFGSSRFEDQEEGEDKEVKLSRWDGGNGGDEGGKRGKGGQKQRKRGGKKKKGDKDSANDVLAVLEKRAKS